jgi:choice-of-anchor A domain-containing protein
MIVFGVIVKASTVRRIAAMMVAASAFSGAVGSSPALANTFAATELSYDAALLNQFNQIVIGNLSLPSDTTQLYTDGRIVAGSVTTGTYGVGNCVASSCSGATTFGASSNPTAGTTTVSTSNPGYGAFTVFGNVAGNIASASAGGGTTTINVQGNLTGSTDANATGYGKAGGISGANTGATVNVGGTLSSTAAIRDTPTFNTTQASGTTAGTGRNSNVGTTNYSQTLAKVFPFGSEQTDFSTPLQNLYSGLANLPGTPGVKADALPSSQSGVFTSGVDYTGSNGKTYGVVTTTLANFSAEGSSFTGVANNSANAATFVIITGTGSNYVLPTITSADSKVIYDFVSASNLQLGGNFDGTILAPLANLVNGTGTVSGTVVVASMTQTQNLYAGSAFTGDLSGLTNFTYNARVPEPASLLLLGSGVSGVAWLRRRRRSRKTS